mgnify:FL=1
MPTEKNNSYFIYLANKLSLINQFLSFPNPSVGAVSVSKNQIISTGVTGPNGSPHAEYDSIKNAKNKKIEKLYVSLIPCTHKGKNPSCTKIIKKKKIKKVIYSSDDYDVRVINHSKYDLKKNKVKISKISMNNPCFNEIKKYNYSKKNELPYVTAKLAISSDYFTKNKNKKYFTNKKALKYAHLLRYKNDSIIVGKNTFEDDLPLLNCRIKGIKKKNKIFLINQNLKFSKNGYKHLAKIKPYIFHSSKNNYLIKKLKLYCNLIYIPCVQNKKIETKLICKKIFKLNCRKLLVEGGLKTQELFLKDNLINEFLIVKSDKNFSKKGRIKALELYKNIKTKFKSEKPFRLDDNRIFRYYS